MPKQVITTTIVFGRWAWPDDDDEARGVACVPLLHGCMQPTM